MSIVNLSQIAQALDAMMPELTPVPVGTIDFAHDVPEGWLECNGAAVSRTKYARLFKKIGTKYGAGDGSTTFNLPNLHHRVLEGTNTTNEVAKYQEAGLPDITGYAYFRPYSGDGNLSVKESGALRGEKVNPPFETIGLMPYGSLGTKVNRFSIKASLASALYKGDAFQADALRLLAIVKF